MKNDVYNRYEYDGFYSLCFYMHCRCRHSAIENLFIMQKMTCVQRSYFFQRRDNRQHTNNAAVKYRLLCQVRWTTIVFNSCSDVRKPVATADCRQPITLQEYSLLSLSIVGPCGYSLNRTELQKVVVTSSYTGEAYYVNTMVLRQMSQTKC